MPRIETNDFAITNLDALSSRYRLYRIKGLNRDHSEYYANRQHIIFRAKSEPAIVASLFFSGSTDSWYTNKVRMHHARLETETTPGASLSSHARLL